VQALGALLLLLCSVSGLNGVRVRASASQAPSLAASAHPFCCRSDVKWKDAGDSKDIQGTTMCRNARTSELLPVHVTLASLAISFMCLYDCLFSSCALKPGTTNMRGEAPSTFPLLSTRQ